MFEEATTSNFRRMPQAEAPSFDTLPEIARKFRRMTARVNATAFHLFSLGHGGERGRLVPCMDSEYPGFSQTSRAMVENLPKRFAEMVVETSAPLWWPDGEGRAQPLLAGGYRARTVRVDTGEAGLALPVQTERGQSGVAIFSGWQPSADARLIEEIHANCYRLFAVVANLRPDGLRARPVSKRELECLKLTANGLTSCEISEQLGLSVHTTNQYLANTTQKLNAVSRAHAVAKALRAGLIE